MAHGSTRTTIGPADSRMPASRSDAALAPARTGIRRTRVESGTLLADPSFEESGRRISPFTSLVDARRAATASAVRRHPALTGTTTESSGRRTEVPDRFACGPRAKEQEERRRSAEKNASITAGEARREIRPSSKNGTAGDP